MLVFYLLDAGIYLLLLWRQNRRSWLFYTCAVSLFIIPFFKVGQGAISACGCPSRLSLS